VATSLFAMILKPIFFKVDLSQVNIFMLGEMKYTIERCLSHFHIWIVNC
jgi:hypothetical protein